MAVFDRAALFFSQPSEVHHTGEVGGDEIVWLVIEQVIKFQGSHFAGNIRESNAEGSSEPAALFFLPVFDQLDALNGVEQGGCGFTGSGSTGVAGVVEGNMGIEGAGPGGDAKFVHNVVGKFEGSTAHGFNFRQVFFIFELERVAVLLHGGTRSGWDDDRQVSLEHLHGMAGHLA